MENGKWVCSRLSQGIILWELPGLYSNSKNKDLFTSACLNYVILDSNFALLQMLEAQDIVQVTPSMQRLQLSLPSAWDNSIVESLINNIPHCRELVWVTSERQYRIVKAELIPNWSSGSPLQVAEVWTDVTAEYTVRRALEERVARHADFYENSPDMYVSVSSKDGHVTNCNATLVRRLGYTSKDDILGRAIFQLYHPDCHDDAHRTFKCFQTHGHVHGAELSLISNLGEKIPVILDVSAINDEVTGELIASRSTLKENLPSVLQKHDEIAVLKDLRVFTYAASHNLQDPIRCISSFSDLLKEHLDNSLDDTARAWFDRISNACVSLRKMSDNLIKFLEISSNRNPSKEEDIAIEPILNGLMAEDLRPLISKTNAQIRFSNLSMAPIGAIDLKRILLALLENSLLHAAVNSLSIDIHAERTSQHWMLSVSDNGHGIPESLANNLFEVFSPPYVQRNNKVVSKGIGLAICKKIVMLYGGDITITNEGGAHCVVTIPLAPTRKLEHNHGCKKNQSCDV